MGGRELTVNRNRLYTGRRWVNSQQHRNQKGGHAALTSSRRDCFSFAVHSLIGVVGSGGPSPPANSPDFHFRGSFFVGSAKKRKSAASISSKHVPPPCLSKSGKSSWCGGSTSDSVGFNGDRVRVRLIINVKFCSNDRLWQVEFRRICPSSPRTARYGDAGALISTTADSKRWWL